MVQNETRPKFANPEFKADLQGRFSLLRLLFLAERRRLKMGTIAANLGIGTNNTTQLVDGMVRDGLVRREPDEDDKRVICAAPRRRSVRRFLSQERRLRA
jgi:DNA-binding MarR family transcriptional regulator